jgi:hypothetical protein
MIPSPNQLKGSTTTATGVIALIAGILGLVSNILNAINGGHIDINSTSASVAGVTAGVGLIHSADANQGGK